MSTTHSTAAVVSVGDELTLGQALDTNGQWISDRLTGLGIVPVEHVTVPDHLARHARAFERLASEVDLVVCTGGLGPTADDLTRQALADAMGDELVTDRMALSQIEAWFGSRGREMSTINAVQALRPTRGLALANLEGTAPGLHGVVMAGGRSCDVFCVPGPPREMRAMFEAQVLPRLRPPSGRTVRTRVLHTIGIGESSLATRLGNMMSRARNPLVGTTASGGVVSIRMRYEGPLEPAEAEGLLAADERLARERAGEFIFAEGNHTLAEAVVSALRASGQTLAVVESCTGGRLGSLVTDVGGSSQVFVGGWLTYSNEMKRALVGVPEAIFSRGGPGAVSAECAGAMALGGLERSGATMCLAITGIAGPEGGTHEKPVGTVWIALAKRGGDVDARLMRFVGDRFAVRDSAAKAALALAWMHLSGRVGTRLLWQV